MDDRNVLPPETLQYVSNVLVHKCVVIPAIEYGIPTNDQFEEFTKEATDKIYTFLTFLLSPDSPDKQAFLASMTLPGTENLYTPTLDQDFMNSVEFRKQSS
jgi:hypothetical protein